MYCKMNIVIKYQLDIPVLLHVLFLYFFWSHLCIVQGQFTLIQSACRNDLDGGCCSAGNKVRLHTGGCPREVS